MTMQDHEIAALVGRLTLTAREHATSQQLRTRIANEVVPVIRRLNAEIVALEHRAASLQQMYQDEANRD